MQLPSLVERFVATQNNFDSNGFVTCFTPLAVVHDEGKTHTGKKEIQQWIEHSNEQYRSSLKPQGYEQFGAVGVLTAEVSGTFPGSPIVLQFHLTLKDDLIQSLKVTG